VELPDPRGVPPMKSFIDSAMHALGQAQAMIGKSTSRGAYFDAIVDLRTTLLDYRQTLTENEEAGIRAWAKKLPDSDGEDGSEDGSEEDDKVDDSDDDDADDGDSDSVFSFDSSYLP
jgi:hypothetical protein